MKIVHVIPALARGGAEGVVIDLANHAVGLGDDVAILCAVPTDPGLHSRPVRPEVELRYLAPARGSSRAAYASMPLWLARNHSWLFRQDVIHCHLTPASIFGTLVQGLRSTRGDRLPVVVETYHAVGAAISGAQKAFHAALLSQRDAVAFMAEDSYWARFRQARPEGLFRTIPNGIVPLPAISAGAGESYRKSNTRIPRGAMVIGSIGRLVPARRPDLLVEAFAKLVRITGKRLHLLLAGEGPERNRLVAQAQALGVAELVHLPGLVLDREGPLGLIDLYLTVNVGPVTGIAALEASFAGLPVIALQFRRDYRNGACDWIPSYADPAALAKRAAELIGDESRLRELAVSQGAFAQAHHGVESMARAYDELYDAALDRRFEAVDARRRRPSR